MFPSGKKTEKQVSSPSSGAVYRSGRHPETDAWHTAFFIENHLDFFGYPEMVASPEQVRFMVYPEAEERYYPCTDRTFDLIVNRRRSPFLKKRYREILAKIQGLIDETIEDPGTRKYLQTLIQIKFDHETRDFLMIPSRLEKRLIRIVLNWTQIDDPWRDEKARRNRRANLALNCPAFKKAIDRMDAAGPIKLPAGLDKMRAAIARIELERLLALTIETSLWTQDRPAGFVEKDFLKIFANKLKGRGVAPLFAFLGIGTAAPRRNKKILWLANEAGEIMIDAAIVQYLVELGHQVIMVFKEGPLFTRVDFDDARDDPELGRQLESAFLITAKDLSKNELVDILRSDNKIFALSDGTREELNLLLASTTLARTFKEVDAVISRGPDQRRRLFDTHFQFTQDIFNIAEGKNHTVAIDYKPRHPDVIKFSHKDLEEKARAIITQMESAKKQGMTVIFYSAIIGSIPGKIKTAKQIISIFIAHLKKKIDRAFIINPSEHYEPGMDADDLMYMWEIVQRSGRIDIWRFQAYDDIARAFHLMGKKVPPEWVGKDATYSTGCTKEMKIALEVQQAYPEMQIIGPSQERFMRRNEYGVGKMYDNRLKNVDEN